LACVCGPFLSPHPFDRVYADYVKVPPQLAPYPLAEQLPPALERLAARIRAKLTASETTDDAVRVTLEGTRAIDERLLAYFERSDFFGPARVVDRQDDGKRLVVEAPIKHLHFLFGTDANGRDLLTRTLIAGRVSLAIGLLASLVALIIGVGWGATAGYLGGRIDMVMMRIVDIIYALPFIFFVILLVVFFGRNFILIFVAVGAVEWLDMARIVRGQTLAIKRQEYVQAAEALGVTTGGIIRRHIVPNTLGPVVAYLTLLVPKVILLESFLSFLGLGVQEPMTSWGVLIAEGARNIEGASYMLIFPALFLTATLFAMNFVGDGLRDALDPKDR
ncbi:MAG: ABC transporter permease subunit, partial [Methylobacteriaceae bacterium]|nr:ABC transporter permease subunit [Methylobacteriaceae bacterium]